MKSITPLSTTAIGSVPFQDVDWTLDLIGRTCPKLPHWPQLVQRHAREDMVLQVADGLPLLEVDEDARSVSVRETGREEALIAFYEHFMANDFEYFRVPEESAVGLTAMLKRAEREPDFGPDFLKGEVTGPITFGLSVRTADDKSLLDDPDLADTVSKGLGAKAAWMAGKMRALGRTPMIFFDEPSLTGFGSAFSTLSGEQVVGLLNDAAEAARAGGEVLTGIHVCGNSDWGMITSTTLDVVNFDAFEFLEHFLLYPKEISAFLERGGYLAWGIVPTKNFTGRETAEQLAGMLRDGWKALSDRGIDLNLVRERSIITPSCGMGSLSTEYAEAIYDLLPQVAGKLE